MPLILGGIGGLAVLIVVVVMMTSKSGDAGDGDGGNQPAAKQPAQPAASSVAMPKAAAKDGKTPDRPAPPLTNQMLKDALGLLDEAKSLSGEGLELRKAGNNMECREKMSQAKVKIDAIKTMLDPALTWQEEADMEGWAQPASYTQLGYLWAKLSPIEKMVRMQGGT